MSTQLEDELEQFQTALLELLAQPLSPEETQRRLHEDEAFASHRDYVESFEPRMIEVAAALVKKWGVRDTSGASSSREAGTFLGYTEPRAESSQLDK